MAKPLRTPKPPRHLTAATRQWWQSVTRDYDLEPHHYKLLQALCEAWDRLQQARETLARDGLTVVAGEGGIKAHPCVAIERDSRIGFARLLRELGLDTEPPADTPRAPPLRGYSRAS
jgi:P27 family predicted phage terminase small subunit